MNILHHSYPRSLHFALFLVVLFSFLPALVFAFAESLEGAVIVGEGGETLHSAVWLNSSWPAFAAGYTCDNTNDYGNDLCISSGHGPDVMYKFISPLGTGTAHIFLYAENQYESRVFAVESGLGYESFGCPSHYGYYGSQLEIDISDYAGLYYVIPDGHHWDANDCGHYDLEVRYTPVQLGNNGNQGTGGTGGGGGLGGGGGIPCSVQNGGNGTSGGTGHPGGLGGNGGSSMLRVFGDFPLYNNSEMFLGGLNGVHGSTGVAGSTGGSGGAGGAPYAGGGAGAEPSPDYQPGTVNGGAGGAWPSGTGSNGNNSGGGGGGGGSSVGVGGGYGAGGGPGASGSSGAGGDGGTGTYFWRPLLVGLQLNDPFQIGGNGGQGGRGGQGGHGGGGGGGAGECWFNAQGAGGTGGSGGAGGVGGSGGTGGNGTIEVVSNGRLNNNQLLTVGRGSSGGSGLIDLGDGGELYNAYGDTIVINSNGQIAITGTALGLTNDGVIINPQSPVENYAQYSGFGTMTGTLVNYGTTYPTSLSTSCLVGTYQEFGRFRTTILGPQPGLCGTIQVSGSATIGAGSEISIAFSNSYDESDLHFGDYFDLLIYPAGMRSGEYENVTSAIPLLQGFWDLVYDQDQGEGLQSIRLVYAEDLSPVDESALPRSFALKSIYPNPFNPSTTISYDLPTASLVRFRVYDVAGRLVWESATGNMVPAGGHQLVWRGLDSRGRTLPSGSYLLKMTAGDYQATRRMALIR